MGSELAVTEHGRTLANYSMDDVDVALRCLILNGGNLKGTSEFLREHGLTVTRKQLENWRDRSFKTRFYELREKLAPEVREEIAGRALERAMQADDAESQAIARFVQEIKEVPAKDLAPAARSLSQAKVQGVQMAELLRDRPTERKEVRSTTELFSILARYEHVIHGQVDAAPPNTTVNGTATELEDSID